MNLEHRIFDHVHETHLYGDEVADSRLHPHATAQHALPAPCERCESGHNGTVVLGVDGRVLYASAGAKTIAARADALALEGGTIRAIRAADDHALQCLIREARLGGSAAAALSLARRCGGRDYIVVVKALPRRVFASAEPAVLVTIADPDRIAQPSLPWLKRLFGLTTAEGRVALKLFAGSTLGEVAAALGVSQATSRVHLAHIFRKTRTTRQAELIRLLMSYPWDELVAAAPEEAR